MRQRFLALLSLFGLAGWTVPAEAQVLKGSKPEDEATKASTIKSSKAAREKAAAKDAVAHKQHQGKLQTMDASSKDAVKMNKAAAEQEAVKVQNNEKPRKGELHGASNDAITVKQKTSAGAQAGKVDSQIKLKKGLTEKNAQHPKAVQENNAAPK